MLYKIIDYIRGLRIHYLQDQKAFNDPEIISYCTSEDENRIGRIALVAIQELIKIQHIKNGGWKGDSIMRMDGNADNYHELGDYNPPTKYSHDEELNESLVQSAKKLLRYGS